MFVTTEIPLPPYDTDADTVPVRFCDDGGDVWFDIFPKPDRMDMHRTVLWSGGLAFSSDRLAAARPVGSSRPDEHSEVMVWEIPTSD